MQPPCYVGILGGVFGRTIQWNLGERDLLPARAAYILEGERRMTKVPLGKLVHPVAATDPHFAATGIEREADHHRIVNRSDQNAMTRQAIYVILDVLPDLATRREIGRAAVWETGCQYV